MKKQTHFKGVHDFPTAKLVCGEGVRIEGNSIVGYANLTHLRPEGKKHMLMVSLGNDVLVRPNSIIYAGCVLGARVMINSNVVVREFTHIGHDSYLGNGTVVEGYTEIGHHTGIHSNCHLTAKMTIGNNCFFGPSVVTGNARKISWPKPNLEGECGPTIGDNVQVGLGACILPRVHIGDGAIIGAGAVVTKDVEAWTIVLGVPARPIGKVDH